MAPMRSRPPAPNPPLETVRYRHIPENEGGILAFTDQTPHCVGTHNCITCVGVYMSISTTRAFVAHINALLKSTNTNVAVRVGITPEEGRRIKDETLRRLKKSAKENGWAAPDVDVERVILVCPWQYDDAGAPRPGKYVVEAIEEFLGKPDGLICVPAQGFVVDHMKGDVWTIPTHVDGRVLKLGATFHGYGKLFEEVEYAAGEDWKVVVKRFDGGSISYADVVYKAVLEDEDRP